MSIAFEPREYWERRLRLDPSIRAVGHRVFSLDYNQWLYRRKQLSVERALATVDLRGARVLDVGCGTGFFVDWYLERGATVTGVDLTRVSVDRLQKRLPDVTFLTGDVSDPSFTLNGETFDIVNVIDVLYHIVDDEGFATALRNLGDSCAGGGLLLTTDRLAAPEDARPAAHVTMRHLARYQSVLPSLGMHLLTLAPLYGWLNVESDPDQEAHVSEYFDREDSHARIAHDNLSLGVWRRD